MSWKRAVKCFKDRSEPIKKKKEQLFRSDRLFLQSPTYPYNACNYPFHWRKEIKIPANNYSKIPQCVFLKLTICFSFVWNE